jgi:hypothetical protein
MGVELGRPAVEAKICVINKDFVAEMADGSATPLFVDIRRHPEKHLCCAT